MSVAALRKGKPLIDGLKLGKLAAVRSPRLSDLSVYTKHKLPPPPASVDAPTTVHWGMDCNDTEGDCTIAAVDHLIGAWNADLGEPDPRPTDQEISDTYFSLTGGADSGLNEQQVLTTWQRDGLFGNRIAAFAPFNPQDIKAMYQAVAFYRGAYLGIQCPQSAQEQFAAGKPWSYVPGSPIEGGHAICAVGYSSRALLCVSWGQLVEVTYPFLSHFLDEAWAIISHEVVEYGSDGVGVDLPSLLADIASI